MHLRNSTTPDSAHITHLIEIKTPNRNYINHKPPHKPPQIPKRLRLPRLRLFGLRGLGLDDHADALPEQESGGHPGWLLLRRAERDAVRGTDF